MEPDRLQLLKRIGITTMVVMVSALILTGVFAWMILLQKSKIAG
jgi:hypothetical protein